MMEYEIADIMFLVKCLKSSSDHFNICDFVEFCAHSTRGSSSLKLKVAVHPRGPRKHCVISYVHIQREIRACAWGQNNSPALHSTVFIRRLRLRELLWSAGTHRKALPLNAERRARRLVQRDGSPYASKL